MLSGVGAGGGGNAGGQGQKRPRGEAEKGSWGDLTKEGGVAVGQGVPRDVPGAGSWEWGKGLA